MSDPAAARPGDRAFFGHPRGLSTLFFTEMWERFSYYGMRALLLLFMVHAANGENPGMGLDERTAGAVYGLYTGLVYLLALPGGWIADRLIGQRHAVLYGGIFIAIGQFFLVATGTFPFFTGILCILIGTGLLKPNISAIVGDLYAPEDQRRDAGFSIYYMGINIGATLAPLVCSYLGEGFNWHWGFGAAGVGMVAGLIQYWYGWKHLGESGKFKGTPEQRAQDMKLLFKALGFFAVFVAAVAGLHGQGIIHLTLPWLAEALTYVIIVTAIVYLGYVAFMSGLSLAESKRVGAIAVLFLAAALFWSGFEQAGSSFNLFAARLTDLSLFGWEMPAGWFQSVNGFFIVAFAPLFAWLWLRLGSRAPSSPAKFAMGLIFLGAGFLVMVFASQATGYSGPNAPFEKVGMGWLLSTYLLHTFGELCLSPVGLSTMTKLAPQRFVGQMLGIWFMASALGNVIAGQIGGLFSALPLPQIFGWVTVTTAGVGLVLLVLSKKIHKLQGGVH